MSIEDNKQIVRSFIERVYNQGDTAFVDEIVRLIELPGQ